MTRATYAKPLADFARSIAPGGKLLSEEVGLLDQVADMFATRAAAREKLSLRHPTGLSDPAAFYGALRASGLFGKTISQMQVDGITALLKAFGAASWPISWAAYGLATAFHETAFTMQPIKEHGGAAYFRKMYDIEGERPAKARELGNLLAGDGARYAGRGYVQLTGRNNYVRAGNNIGIDLVAEPDRAMECEPAAQIMVSGMEAGWFTGKKMADMLPRVGIAQIDAFIQARRIINGLDKAQAIAGHAAKFQAALTAGGWK